jgi:pSer/pThr/pTyr-binding forkhead associated (FHA) protein
MFPPTASVVLHPISPLGPESSITRSFTLSNSNPIFEIGRSSKREVKNRTPAKDNGWFDSRVMSRDHAELGFNMDNEVSSHYLPFSSFPRRMGYAEPRYPQKMIYIRDFGSTHGTWLNNIKLVTDEATPLLNGDILRFGIDVDRGDGAS